MSRVDSFSKAAVNLVYFANEMTRTSLSVYDNTRATSLGAVFCNLSGVLIYVITSISTSAFFEFGKDSAKSLCPANIKWLQPCYPLFQAIKPIYYVYTYPYKFAEKALNSIGINNDNPLITTIRATAEESFFRLFIQQKLLAGIQASILTKVSPNYANLADQKIAKISRIALTSIIFGLSHTNQWDCDDTFSPIGYVGAMGTIPQIISGFMFGMISETSMGVYGSALAHTSYNLIA